MFKELNENDLVFVSGNGVWDLPVVTNIAGAIYGASSGLIAGAIAGGVAGGFATGGILGTLGGTLGYIFAGVWGAINGGIVGALKGYEFVRLNIGNEQMYQNWRDLLNWDGNYANPVVKG